MMSESMIAKNRKAFHEYNILETFEGGLVLLGAEVKAIREGKGNIKEAYIRFIGKELYILGMHIGEYSHSGYSTHNPLRDRKLLMNKAEIFKIRRDFENEFRSQITDKYEGSIKVEFAFQELNDLPNGFKCPEGRQKPWGTGHAILTAAEMINEPFVAIKPPSPIVI